MGPQPATRQRWGPLDHAAWSGVLADRVFPVAATPLCPDTFSVGAQMWSLGAIGLLHHTSDAIQYRRESWHLKGEREESLLVPFAIDTTLRFAQDGVERLCGPGQFMIERSGSPYDFRQETRGELWTLMLPLAAFGHEARRIESCLPHVFDASEGMGALLLDFLRMVPARLSTEAGPAAADLGDVVLDLLLCALRHGGQGLGGRQGAVRHAHLARIERFIRGRLGDRDLDPAGIAAANGISLRYLHKLFGHSGTSVGQWIAGQRLAACDRDLRRRRPGETVAEIAYRWGFADAAHFSRAFKARYGVSPRERQASRRPA